MAAPGGAAAACAACKYQRRRCAADCPLAHYFPHDRPRVFRNAHHLFGVRNILRTLKHAGADPGRRHEAMQCVVYESQAWDLYPSAGCVPIIHGLQHRIQQAEHELRRVHADLQAYRRHRRTAAAAAAAPPLMSSYSGGGHDEQQQQQMMAMVINNNAAVTSDDGNTNMAPPPLQTSPWTMQPPPQYEHHPFFVDDATTTTMVPHFQHQPILVSTQLPELQADDMMNYFADDGINAENDKTPRESSTDSSDEKAMTK